MRRYTRGPAIALAAALVVWIVLPSAAQEVRARKGQNFDLHDSPKVYVAKTPPTRQELDRRESLYQYAEGLLLERVERLTDALKAYEAAARLDPDAPAPCKAQVPILIGMDRYGDALAMCKKVVALDPGDFSTWYAIAKLHKSTAAYAEAIAALERGLKSAALEEHPEAAQQIYLELAGLYENADKFAPAADAYTKAAEILEHPDRIEANAHVPRAAVLARASETYEKIGNLYRKAKQYDRAIAALVKAQDRAPERAGRLNYTLAQIAEEADRLPAALKYVDAYLDTRPLSTDAHEMKIRMLRAVKKTDAIVPWLEEAAGRERFNTALQLLLAKECARAKLNKKAETIYVKLAEESPSAELYRGLFRVYQNDGPAGMARTLGLLDSTIAKATPTDGTRSLSALQRAKAMIAALREDGALAMSLVDAAFRRKANEPALKYDTVYFLATLADQHRKSAEAERFYRQALQGAELANEPIIYSGLLRALAQQRKNEEAIAICKQGLKGAKATNPLLFYRELARAHAALHHYDDALRQADRAIKRAGDDNRFIFELLRLRILTAARRFDDAEIECKALLKTHDKPGETVELRYVLSNIYSASKQQAKSEGQLQLLLKIDPNNATANNDLGYFWADQNKNLEAAETMIRRALEFDRSQRRRNPNLSAQKDKDNAAYVDSLGWVLFRRGKIEEAKKELERATTLADSDDPVIYDHLGDVYNRLKMRPEAARAWQRALELYDTGVRGKDDERTRDLRRKIEQAKEQVGGR